MPPLARSLRRHGRGFPALPVRVADGVRLRALGALRAVVEVPTADGEPVRLRVATPDEYNRATHALVQEPGTIAWLRRSLGQGDTFCDVGASIGIFSMLAARLVGSAGRVLAVEPHVATAGSLLENLARNGLTDRVDVLTCGLSDQPGPGSFHYRSLVAGSGLSQLGATEDPHGVDQAPVATELKLATTLDALVGQGVVEPPTAVKIDVDGLELAVLCGMAGVLRDSRRPRTCQVEINPRTRAQTIAFLAEVGYRLADRHRSREGDRMVATGTDPETLGFNGIFEPA